MDKNNKNAQSNIKDIVTLIKTDCGYSGRFYTEKKFAKKELTTKGIQFNSDAYDELSIGYKKVADSLKKILESSGINDSEKAPFQRIRFSTK